MKEEPRIPTLVGIAILLIGLGSAIFLLERGFTFFVGADTPTVSEVTVANVSDASFSVSWLTDKAAIGAIEYQETGLLGTKRVQFDDRDDQNTTPRYTHFVTVTGLTPNTNYEVTLVTADTKKEQLSLKTGPTLPPPTAVIDPAFGTVVNENNAPAQDVLVHATFEGSQIAASITDTKGSWVIPLGSLRSEDANRYFVPRKQDQERLFFVSPEGKSIVTTSISNDSPLPQVRLGESYDFTSQTGKRGPIIAQAAQPLSQSAGTVNASFRIQAPLPNSSIPSGFPAIKGTGVPGKQVLLTISEIPTPLTQTVSIGSTGTWSWTPTKALSPGKHILSATSYTTSGAPQAASVSFTVLKSGSQVLQAATPSGTLTSPSPIASILPSPSLRASVSPIASASAAASSSATIPVSGNTQTTFLLVLVATVGLALGILGTFKKSA